VGVAGNEWFPKAALFAARREPMLEITGLASHFSRES
jgi:hypothetical protein